MSRRVDPRLWHVGLGLVAIALAAALALIVALALGWNNPRPGRPPDWEAPHLPRRLEAPPDDTSLSLLGHPGGDFTFEAIARPIAPPQSGLYGYGLIYRAQDPSNYYAFGVGGDGYYAVVRVEGGEEIPLVAWQQFPHVRRGARANRLRVSCAGAICRLTINDEHAATVEDHAWLRGDVGLWARGFDEGVVDSTSSTELSRSPQVVTFSGVRLWESGEPAR